MDKDKHEGHEGKRLTAKHAKNAKIEIKQMIREVYKEHEGKYKEERWSTR